MRARVLVIKRAGAPQLPLSYGPQKGVYAQGGRSAGAVLPPPREQVLVHLYVDEYYKNVLTSGKIKVAGTHLNLVERDNVEVGLDKAWAAQGPPRGELIVAVPTPNAAGFIMEIEI